MATIIPTLELLLSDEAVVVVPVVAADTVVVVVMMVEVTWNSKNIMYVYSSNNIQYSHVYVYNIAVQLPSQVLVSQW